jgi:hypothetical protein
MITINIVMYHSILSSLAPDHPLIGTPPATTVLRPLSELATRMTFNYWSCKTLHRRERYRNSSPGAVPYWTDGEIKFRWIEKLTNGPRRLMPASVAGSQKSFWIRPILNIAGCVIRVG